MTLVVSHWPGLSHTGQTQNGLGYKGEWMLAIGVWKMQVGWQWRKFAVTGQETLEMGDTMC